MPNWVSKEGVWEPSQERVVDPKAPVGKEIYEGPDRAAMAQLEEQKVESLGQHYSTDPEVVMRARQLGFKDVEEYLNFLNYNKEKAKKRYEENKSTVITHKDPERKPSVLITGGGEDTSGQGKHRRGGYEHPDDAPATMVKPNS